MDRLQDLAWVVSVMLLMAILSALLRCSRIWAICRGWHSIWTFLQEGGSARQAEPHDVHGFRCNAAGVTELPHYRLRGSGRDGDERVRALQQEVSTLAAVIAMFSRGRAAFSGQLRRR